MIAPSAAVAGWSWIVDARRRTREGDSAGWHGRFGRVACGAARRDQAVAGVGGEVIYASTAILAASCMDTERSA
jgi:hypothetical protein